MFKYKRKNRRKLVVPRLWNWNNWESFYARINLVGGTEQTNCAKLEEGERKQCKEKYFTVRNNLDYIGTFYTQNKHYKINYRHTVD